MNKIGLVIKREYTTRVMKPSFIILTFLTPVLIAAMVMLPLLLAQIRNETVNTIVVIDQTALYASVFEDTENFIFEYTGYSLEEIRSNREPQSYTALLVITDDLNVNPQGAALFSREQISIELKAHVEATLREYVEQQRINALNIPNIAQLMEETKADIHIRTVMWGDDGEELLSSTELALAVGLLTAFLIYIFIVMYGAQVMSGVVQEKTNRIVEVIVSSVKPFQLMMGKIVGIALVGLTQFGLWVLLTMLLVFSLTQIVGIPVDVASYQQTQLLGLSANPMAVTPQNGAIAELLVGLANFDFIQTGILFVVYFLGGYLLYASLFAAVGSAVDNETDTQQFSLPLTLPIIFAIYAAIYSAENPDGPLAFWCSMIPFTSPIVMMVRLPFGVAWWEIALSIGILVASFIASTWLAARIYRTGILMYGKKITWKEMIKWITYRN